MKEDRERTIRLFANVGCYPQNFIGSKTFRCPVCSDNRKPFTMVYYNDIDPQAAVMTWGNDQAIVFPQPAASGAKYGRVGIEYWEHQGEASVDFFGNKLSCKPVR